MVNVWTVLWVGEFAYRSHPAGEAPGKFTKHPYGPDDVRRYERMVRRWLPDCQFYCLTNVDIPGIRTIELQSKELLGWWPKMELFRPKLPGGRNVYFDLDTLIVGDVQEIVDYPAPFAAIEVSDQVGSNRPEPWLDQEGKWRVPRYQTSVMVWDSKYGHRFWKTFKPEHLERLASDQDFLGEVFPDEALLPWQWFAKVGHCKKGPKHPLKVVLSGSGRNADAARRYPWAGAIWNA